MSQITFENLDQTLVDVRQGKGTMAVNVWADEPATCTVLFCSGLKTNLKTRPLGLSFPSHKQGHVCVWKDPLSTCNEAVRHGFICCACPQSRLTRECVHFCIITPVPFEPHTVAGVFLQIYRV